MATDLINTPSAKPVMQRSLRRSVTIKGTGLHTGKRASVSIHPAPAGTGILFIRADIKQSPEILAHFSRVVSTQLATTLGTDGVTVSTVEHLLATFVGMAIDNAVIEVSGPEVPVLDGSAALYCEAFEAAGIVDQDLPRRRIRLLKPIEVRIGEKWAIAEPCEHLEIHGTVEFDHPYIGYQEAVFIEGQTPFSEIAPARTFGFFKDVQALRRMGLTLGGSLENAVVLDEVAIMNPEGLRFGNEFARHKVLDALGDFCLAGAMLSAKIRLHRAGHDLHRKLLEEWFRDAANFDGGPVPAAQSESQGPGSSATDGRGALSAIAG